MRRIAKFHKVSPAQFAKDWKDTFEQYSEEEIRNIYDSLKLPKRATTGSAGYDFCCDISQSDQYVYGWRCEAKYLSIQISNAGNFS